MRAKFLPKIETVSPFPAGAIPRAWEWMQSFMARVADDYGPKTKDEFVDQFLSRAGVLSWGVLRDGELGGMVTFQPVNPTVGVMHVLYRKEFWGKAITDASMREICRDIFGRGFNKITSLVFADNNAIIAMAMRGGGKREGLLRQQTMRGGKPADMVAIGILREDFE
jgi:RimJ/RimL family protein N-acetyltransferase